MAVSTRTWLFVFSLLFLLSPSPILTNSSQSICTEAPPSGLSNPVNVTFVQEMANGYRVLRGVKGYFGGEEWDDRVDSPTGEKYKQMKALQYVLVCQAPSKTADAVLAVLDMPDHITQNPRVTEGFVSDGTSITMPGPVIGETNNAIEEYYVVYFWRNKHDYLWFKIRGENVAESGWYMTLDKIGFCAINKQYNCA